MKKNAKKKKLIAGIALWLSMIMAMPVYGDDTEIYGGMTNAVPPNVLILFDTSTSMKVRDIVPAGESYDPRTSYDVKPGNSYDFSGLRSSLFTFTYPINGNVGAEGWQYGIYDSNGKIEQNDQTKANYNPAVLTAEQKQAIKDNHTMTYDNVQYATGNYIIWLDSRKDVAQAVMKEVIGAVSGVRIGLMRFTGGGTSQTGKVVHEIEDVDAAKGTLTGAVSALDFTQNTPLASALAEAGYYFAGNKNIKSSMTGNIYTTSPVQYDCQVNYIIVVTDGAPFKEHGDGAAIGETRQTGAVTLKNNGYLHGKKIREVLGLPTNDVPTLADVAEYLHIIGTANYNLDADPPVSREKKHTINVLTVGFKTDQPLLRETARRGSNRGESGYFTAETKDKLVEVLTEIMKIVNQNNSVFVSPVVPVNQQNRTFAGDRLYVGFFKPNSAELWEGNLKQYALDKYGVIKDQNGNDATNEDGQIKDNAKSYWSTTSDGSTVTKGGAGGVLNNMTARKLYTNLDATKALSDSANSFSKDNQALTNEKLGVNSNEDRDTTIDTLLNGTTSSTKDGSLWKMGDVLHSTPAVVAYDNDSYIFVGTNRGVLHAFSDSNGEEEWGFIPRPQLPRLQKLWDAPYEHNYFVDGAPAVYRASDGDKILLIGERRGGNNYYALDVTSITSPEYKYAIPEVWSNSNSALTATMAQSWANPTVHKVKTDSSGQTANVFLLTGGYDKMHDTVVEKIVKEEEKEVSIVDAEKSWRGRIPENAPNTKGNSVFMVNVDDGSVTALDSTNLEDGTVSIPHSIVDVAGFDYNDDTWTDRVYAGDLGGNIWAFEDHSDLRVNNNPKTPNGKWTGKRLFVDDARRKIFYAPDVVLETGGEDMIFFGTGDRAAPKDTSLYDAGEYDRIYAIKNDWLKDEDLTPADDLYDATKNLIQDGNDEEKGPKGTAQLALDKKRGWYFDLEHKGEKIISSVLVYDGVLYFTTYTPAAPVAVVDPCNGPSDLGTARLYAVDYRNGTAVLNFNDKNDPTGGELLDKSDRCKEIGAAIPSSPVIAILEGKAVLFVGISGGIMSESPLEGRALNQFYWKMPLE